MFYTIIRTGLGEENPSACTYSLVVCSASAQALSIIYSVGDDYFLLWYTVMYNKEISISTVVDFLINFKDYNIHQVLP